MGIRVGGCDYLGRFQEKAVALIKSGTRVGMMWLGTEPEVHCHVCNKDFPPPKVDEQTHDHFGECPHCHTPFIFADALKYHN